MAGENDLKPLEQFYLLLPILVSSAILIQLPGASQSLLNKWRALQLYDSQEVNEEEKEKAIEALPKHSISKKVGMSLFSILVVLVPELFLFGTADMKLCPTLTLLRENVAQYYLCLIGLLLIFSTVPISNQNIFVGRSDSKTNSQFIAKGFRTYKFAVPSFKFFLVALVPALYIFLVFYLPIDSLIIPTFLAVIFGGNLIRLNAVVLRKFISFRGLMMAPILYVMFCTFVGAIFIAIANEVERRTVDHSSSPSASGDGTSAMESWGKALAEDKASEKLFYAIRPYMWIISNIIPAALIALGYRYDSINAGITLAATDISNPSTVPENPTEVIKVENSQGSETPVVVQSKFDTQGKRPTQLSCVSIPRLSIHQTPIFKAGLLTLFATHAITLLASLILPVKFQMLDDMLFDNRSPSRMAMESLFSSIPPGWFGTILVPIAMLIRAAFTKEGSLKLWSYHEKWGADKPKKVEEGSEKVDVKEEHQSLLEDMD